MKEAAIRNRGKTRTALHHRVYALALAIIMLLAFTAGGAYAAAPLAGSQIGNQASATYQDGVGGPVKTATSNTVYTYVQQVASLTLTINAQTKSVSVGGTVYFMHTVTNTGNGNDTFALSAAKASGSATLSVPATIYSDTGSGPGPALSPAQTISLAPGGTFNFWYSVTASGSAISTDSATTTVTATSAFNGSVNTTNSDTVTVTPFANIAVNKYIDSVTTVGATTTINYRIHYINNGNNTATAFKITDAIPAGTGYVLNSGRWSTTGATVLTDANNADAQGTAPNTIIYDYNVTTATTITAVINQVLAGAQGDVTFQVTFPASTGPGTITNTANFQYSDGGGNTPTGSATVVYTIPTVRTVVLDDVGSTTDSDGANDSVNVASVAQGGVAWFDNVIHNNGNVADTYQMSYSGSTFPASTIQYYDAKNGTLLSGGVTGSVAAGATYHVWVKVTLSMSGTGGPFTLLLKSTSSNDNTVSDTVTDRLGTIAQAIVDITNNSPYNAGTPAPGQGISDGSGAAITTTAGSSATPAVFSLYLNNIGATDETYGMTYSATTAFSPAVALPAGWTVNFFNNGSGVCSTLGAPLAANTTATVVAGTNVLVCAVVTPPAGATGGTTQDVYFKATGSNTGASDIKHDAVTVATAYTIVITPNNTGQIAPNGSKVYSHTVTNNGNVAIGKTAGSLTFSTADTKAGWTTVLYYDSNSNGVFDGGDAILTDLNQIVGAAGLAPGASVTIFVKVQAPATTVGDVDTTTINLTSTKSLPVPKIVGSATDTTTMVTAQLTIDKFQAIDSDCSGTNGGAGLSFKQTDITVGAVPGACIRYRLVVNNSGSQAATNLQVTDVLVPYSVYNKIGNCFPGTGGTTGASGTVDAVAIPAGQINEPAACATSGTITFTIPTFNAGSVATMFFEVQINK